jgi:Baseplate J-like protein
MTLNNNPQKPENRPGLPQLVYRITDYNASRKWLLSLLRDSLRPDRDEQQGPLFNLTTRDQDDTGVAILDAWAVMADVLTFYQERIANEGYLRTATERRSVLELARMIGYELDPGVAASTYLAFTLEDATDSAETATIPQGTQVMSIPGEDELPQTFETSEEFIARVDWNNLQPRTSRPQNIWSPTKQNPNVNRQLYFKGVNTQLKPGDFILLLDQDFQDRRYLLLLADVNVNASEDYTVVNCQKAVSVSGVDLPETKILLQNPQVFAFQQKAFLFGYDAPTSVRVFVDPATTLQTLTWSDIQNSLNNPTDKLIDLDSLYGQILKDSWIVLYDTSPTGASTQKAYTIANTLSVARARSVVPVVSIPPANSENLGQISLVTRVELNADKIGNARSTIVLAQSELLELVPEPLIVNDRQVNIFQDPIQGKTVFLREFVQKLHRDQTLMVSGQRIRVQLKDVGGVLKSVSTTSWEKINNGLTNSQIRSLAIKPDGTILAGTTEGIFFCQNNGTHQWQPVLEWNSINKTLEDKAIQTLQISDNFILTGTAQGLFRAVHLGDQWQPVITSDVRVIYVRSSHPILIGTINGGVLQSSDEGLDKGLTWRTTGLNNTDVQSLISVESSYTFAGTISDGIFRSSDPALLTWEKITSIRKGLGTITTNGNIVQGDSAANFQMQLQSGDVINVGDQSRSVLEINSYQQLTIDRPFCPDLTTNTSFTIDTGLTNRNITALGTKPNFVFAGTAGSGIFRSEGGNNSLSLGDRWRAVNTGLTDLEIRCLAIADNSDIWVGTSKDGVFRSTNNGESWENVSANLTNLDVRAILPPTDQRSAFVGGIGILQTPPGSYPIPMQKGDILQVLEPPAAIPGNSNYRLWKLMDKDGFQGDLITTTDSNSPEFENEITLLPALEDSTVVSEIAMVQNPPIDQQHPILTLQHSLQYAYDPATVRIYANVVPATHGETIEEVLGSGDGHLSNQRFGLNKPPLTYVPAANARGSASSLGLRVNGVLWSERPSLYPLQSFDQNYILRIQDDGSTIITFGDGTKGARLPSGLENITATYRSGIGLEGNLIAEQLSLLKTRPLGVSEVINPLPATGGAPRESLTEARINAPATVRTLDRIVSIRDFTDFAQGFAGIGKAQALPLWNGETQMVHITIAAAQGNAVLQDSNLYTKLVAAIEQARDPIQQVQVDSYERLLFNIAARLLLDPRYEAKVVNAKIYHTLKTIFAFEQRQFSQDVTAAEVIAAIQTVAGVIAVDLDALYQVGRSKARERSLPALSARYDVASETIKPAQLLQLNPAGIQLTIVSTL